MELVIGFLVAGSITALALYADASRLENRGVLVDGDSPRKWAIVGFLVPALAVAVYLYNRVAPRDRPPAESGGGPGEDVAPGKRNVAAGLLAALGGLVFAFLAAFVLRTGAEAVLDDDDGQSLETLVSRPVPVGSLHGFADEEIVAEHIRFGLEREFGREADSNVAVRCQKIKWKAEGYFDCEASDRSGEFYVRVSMDDREGRYTWQLGGRISNFDEPSNWN